MPPTDPMAYAPCKIPLRRAMGVFGGVNLAVHEGIYADVMEADRRWRAAGGKSFFNVRIADTGCYNCRPSVGHSRAVAIDFNWQTQQMGPKRVPCPQDPGMAEFYRICWKPLGYGWGNNWNSKCDAMHISKLRSEGGNGVLYQTWPEEGDDLPYTEAQLKAIFRDVIREELGKKEAGAFKNLYLWLTYKARNGLYRQGIDDIVKATNADPTTDG